MTETIELSTHYRLASGVAIRPERFGGLIYRYDNRRLYFLRSHQAVDLINHLDGQHSLQDVLNQFVAARNLPDTARASLVVAVAQLAKLGVLTSPNSVS